MTDSSRTREHLEVLADALATPGEGAIPAGDARKWTPICGFCHARPKMDRCGICEECWYA